MRAYEFSEIQVYSNKSNKLYLSGKVLILIHIIFRIMIQAKNIPVLELHPCSIKKKMISKSKRVYLWKGRHSFVEKFSQLVALTVIHVGLSYFSGYIMYLFCLFIFGGWVLLHSPDWSETWYSPQFMNYFFIHYLLRI
jgi:uncharacterized membrane protein